MKKKILHIIYDLKRGGAETILVTTVQELDEYNHVIVTLFPGFEFEDSFLKNYKVICLGLKHFTLLPFYIPAFKKIIRENDIDIVHSRLYWPTFLARLSTPAKIPLITTIHSYIADSVEYRKPIIRWLEKFSYRFHKTIMLADSQGALEEYFSFLKLRPFKSVSPFTFVDTRIFNKVHERPSQGSGPLKMISVGRLTVQKNHQYIIEAFRHLKDQQVELDIYGMGNLHDKLKQQVAESGSTVYLKGRVSNIQELIPGYDLFVMPSTYEGFSLAVLEAMAMGIPMMLSDIPSFREQCADTAVYFKLDDPLDFARKFIALQADKEKLQQMGNAGRARVMNNFTLAHHMKIIREVYADAVMGG